MSDEDRAAQAAEADDARASAAQASDMDETDADAAEADAAPAAETDGAEATPEEAEKAAADDDEPAKRRPRRSAKERISELTRQKREAEARARRAEEALAKAKPPKIEDFDDDDAYEAARHDYHADRRRARDEQTAAQEAAKAIERETARDFVAHAAAFKAEAPDFEQVAYSAPISDEIAGAIARMGEDGPRVAYHLGKHPDLARELSDMDPYAAAVELGRLAATQRRPARKVVSNAPPPVKPAAAGGPTNPDPTKMSYEDYRRWRMGS